MNVYLSGPSERIAAIASIPVTFLALWGFLHWRNPRLTLSVTSTALILLLYEYGIRHFSYGYHKLAANLSFLLIGAFATGVARAVENRARFPVRRYAARAALTLLAVVCLLATIPLVEAMERGQESVSPDLVELTTIKQLARDRAIRLIENRYWQQVWAVYFLDPVPTLLDTPNVYFPVPAASVSRNELRLVSKSQQYFSPQGQAPSAADQVIDVSSGIASLAVVPASEKSRVVWQNSSYLLLDPGFQLQSLRLSGQTPDRWITSEGLTLEMPGEWVQHRHAIELSGRTILLELLSGKLNVDAKIDFVGRPPEEAPATIEEFADHYVLRIELNPASLRPHGEVHVRISFDKYFVPEEFGLNSDTRRLVIMMPETVRLIR
jgi:hypothetical protein